MLKCCNFAMLLSCKVEKLQCCNVVMLHYCNVTMLQCCKVTTTTTLGQQHEAGDKNTSWVHTHGRTKGQVSFLSCCHS